MLAAGLRQAGSKASGTLNLLDMTGALAWLTAGGAAPPSDASDTSCQLNPSRATALEPHGLETHSRLRYAASAVALHALESPSLFGRGREGVELLLELRQPRREVLLVLVVLLRLRFPALLLALLDLLAPQHLLLQLLLQVRLLRLRREWRTESVSARH